MVELVYDLLIILTAGFAAGIVSKRFGFSMLVGYLLAGAVIGRSGIGLIAENLEEIEHLAHGGALLLLFAIGIEFSLEELVRLSRYFFLGGAIQMMLVAAPVAVACMLFGGSWKSALLIACGNGIKLHRSGIPGAGRVGKNRFTPRSSGDRDLAVSGCRIGAVNVVGASVGRKRTRPPNVGTTSSWR